jgi:hypothetical protein
VPEELSDSDLLIRVSMAAHIAGINPVIEQIAETLEQLDWPHKDLPRTSSGIRNLVERAVVQDCNSDPTKIVEILVHLDKAKRLLVVVDSERAPEMSHKVFVADYQSGDHELVVTNTLVSASDFSFELLAALKKEPIKLNELSPNEFELFVCDRLDAMGLDVTRVGSIYEGDGGIDIIACPRLSLSVPFLLAVQVKHHRSLTAKTGPSTVREMQWVTQERGFNAGMLVTNTSFTPTAQWEAAHGHQIIRLRDLFDMQRWLRGNFLDGEEWREIPEWIEYAPGKRIRIPRPRFRK